MRRIEYYYLTGELLGLRFNPNNTRSVQSKFAGKSIDFGFLAGLWDQQLISPAVYLALRDHELLDCVPKSVSDYLKEVHRLNRERNEQVITQINGINACLHDHGIKPLYIKGIGNLLDGLHSDFGERFMVDIDLIVAEAEFYPTIEALLNFGYFTEKTPDFSNQPGRVHFQRLFKTNHLLGVEVHRLFSQAEYTGHFTYANSIRGMRVPVLTTGCFVLSDRDKVIMNMIHSQLHHKEYKHGEVNFRQTYDLALLSQRVDIQRALKDYGLHERKFTNYLFFSAKLFRMRLLANHSLKGYSLVYRIKVRLGMAFDWWIPALKRISPFLSVKRLLSIIRRFVLDPAFRKKWLGRLFSGTLFSYRP